MPQTKRQRYPWREDTARASEASLAGKNELQQACNRMTHEISKHLPEQSKKRARILSYPRGSVALGVAGESAKVHIRNVGNAVLWVHVDFMMNALSVISNRGIPQW